MLNAQFENNHSIPFVVLTETWLKSYVTNAQLHIPGYEVSRCDRNKKRGGGVLLYSHQNLPISQESLLDDGTCQVLFCRFDTIKTCLAIIYRPPHSSSSSFKNIIKFLESEYEALGDDSYKMCFTGDFNFPGIDWESQTIQPGESLEDQASANLLLNFMSTNLLCQYINVPTRKNNILDLFITSDDRLVTNVSSDPTNLSDHNIVDIMLSFNPLSVEQHQFHKSQFEPDSFRSLDFQKADFDKIRSKLENVEWHELRELCSFEEFPILFTYTLFQICQSCTPLKDVRAGRPRALNALSRRKRKLKARCSALESRVTSPPEHLKSVRDKLALVCYDMKEVINRNYEQKELAAVKRIKSNPKFFYSYAKSKSQVKSSINMLLNKSDEIVTNKKGLTDILQDQFTSVYSDPNSPEIRSAEFPQPTIGKQFEDYDIDITDDDIISAIKDIKVESSPGPDGIPAILLKNCASELCDPIIRIWKESYSSGIVPQFYKQSFVTPLYKKGDRAKAINYRPISLTSHIIKLYERIIRRKVVAYLEENDILCHKQHGFRSGRSCLTQMLGHFDEIMHGLSKNNDTDSIYLDYAKAFDKVDHKLLLAKLQRYGFSCKFISWIKSFLTNRPQNVVLDGVHSYIAMILSGVPQGTVLGPILFILFINDLDHCVKHSTVRFFADDTRISKQISSENDVELLQNDLNSVITWSRDNNMVLHEDKFNLIIHKHQPKSTIYELPFVSETMTYHISNGSSLSPVSSLKDLGIIVSADLSWSTHISTIVSRSRSILSWVFSVFRTRDITTMMTLYKSLVRSHLEYCCPLWHPSSMRDIKLIEGVQRSFTSRIYGVQHFNYWERLKALGLMSLQRRRERYIIIQMWKILHTICPNDVNVQFKPPSRLGVKAKLPALDRNSSQHHQSLYDFSFGMLGPRLWNCLPKHISQIADLDMFKQDLTKFLLTFPDNPPADGYVAPNDNSLPKWCENRAEAHLLGRLQNVMTL